MGAARSPVDDKIVGADAAHDFSQLRMREILGRLRNPFRKKNDRLLSLEEVKTILRPSSEAYQGMRVVPLGLIVGSEGRYNDFTRSFLPRHAKLRARWMRVDNAFYNNINLPPVRLYELGGAYFIRDGNHRVSVALQQGGEFIDAEVTSLGTYFQIRPGMTTGSRTSRCTSHLRDATTSCCPTSSVGAMS